jgi:hypothetical protein
MLSPSNPRWTNEPPTPVNCEEDSRINDEEVREKRERDRTRSASEKATSRLRFRSKPNETSVPRSVSVSREVSKAESSICRGGEEVSWAKSGESVCRETDEEIL